MWAIISDVHGNLEALTAVLADIDRHPVSRVVCLGDTFGYGPDPVACLDLVRDRCEVALMGNFDLATIIPPDAYSPTAARSLDHGRRQMETRGPDTEARWAWLAARPGRHREGGRLFVHGSARDPLHEYAFPEDIYNRRKMERIFDLIDEACFCGHTHLPGIWVEGAARDDSPWLTAPGDARTWAFAAPEEGAYHFQLDGRKTIVNVGSVGQPRDGDPRAGYALLDGDRVTFRRVAYDIETTVRKIYAIGELENFLGDRLRDGR